MKILKPGKVEQRKFVCPNCECKFVMYKSETIRTIDLEGKYHYWAQCPCRDQIAWDNGEPYDPEPDMEADRKRLQDLIYEWETCHFGGVPAAADFLLANGVTFREG